MKAMIFAAGLGSRLGERTKTKPKALVLLQSKPLIYYVLQKLQRAGFNEFVVNVHHHASLLEEYLNDYTEKFPCTIHISDERKQLLDTGGALRKAAPFFDGKAVLIYNTDVLSDIDISHFINYFSENKCDALLAVRNRLSSRYLLFDQEMQLFGWRNKKNGKEILIQEKAELIERAFSGIHIVSPEVYNNLPEMEVFPIIPSYLKLANSLKISGFDHSEGFWVDLGKPEQINDMQYADLQSLAF